MANPDPQQSSDAARVRCLYCGANNYPQSTVCWQCQRPLQAIRNRAAAGDTDALAKSISPPRLGGASQITTAVETNLANKAAFWLGLLFPIFGLPVGLVFLMLDDPRKTKLGWQVIIWSVIGLVLSLIPILLTLPFLPDVRGLIKSAPSVGGGDNLNLLGLPFGGW
jgi:hypothetical protein